MKRFLLTTLFSLLFCASAISQTPSPQPTPPPAAENDDVVKITTSLIQVDVTVTDKSGKIVTDLKPEDFEIFENGKKQEITNFSYVAADTGTKTAVVTKKEKGKTQSIPLPPVPLKNNQVRRTITLLVDDLGLSFESIHFVRRALRKFVDEQMQPNDLVAIIRSSGGAGALQQFTTDKRQLYAAINAVKWNASGRAGISAFAPIEATTLETAKSLGQEVTDEQLQEERRRNAGFNNFREDIFAVGTLGAINFVVKGMNELPGRKSIILFSDGFSIAPNKDDPNRGERVLENLRRLTELANRASVTIYTIDARGLQTLGLTAADNTAGLNSQQVQQRISDRSAQLFDTQDGLSYLAKETGGRAFFNNNDINQGITNSLEDQKGYYLIGYQPDDETFDPKKNRFNRLDVKLNRKDLRVRYRSGFFGIEDKAVADTQQSAARKITSALTSPFAINDIELRLNTLFGTDAKTGAAAAYSFLHVKTQDLKFETEPDGTYKASFDILAIGFGVNGIPVEQLSKNITYRVKKENYEKAVKEGIVLNFSFPIKKPGAYQMRVAIRDIASQKLGSAGQFVEIPDLKKGKLTLGGIVLENITEEQWKKINSGIAVTEETAPMTDTSLRRFKKGTILRYGAEVFNAKRDAAQNPSIDMQVRVFRDGKLVLDGQPKPFAFPPQAEGRLSLVGALSLGGAMPVGEYVLQIVTIDKLAKAKNQMATQWIQFEIVN